MIPCAEDQGGGDLRGLPKLMVIVGQALGS